MIRVRNLSFSYNGRAILRDIAFEVKEGEFLAILGPNGAGKSTLLRCLAKILKCEGEIEICGRNLHEYSRRELSKTIAYVPQRVEPNFLRVFDMVLLGRKPYMGIIPSEEDIKAVERALKTLKIEHLAGRLTKTLSGGELQKVAIARALAQESSIILLDEPTNNLDPRSQVDLMNLLRKLSQAGKTIVTVMHDINLALRFAEKLMFMKNGEVVGIVETKKISPEIIEETFNVKAEIFETPSGVKFCQFY
ncbi:ABC transporter ATP-binding protein [Pyrococcus furiosus DSM 3638]|uniref:Ferric enterobactin transport ATP-binding protein homolog n=3 Tax=Pyrococcus furiosus TaxID=2261 RepID=Q8U2D0_PYRFU|nr:ABC transporter ATP-binding protein [Pyrococcus furiosus]AAL81033.1 ferric enterobactin transport ATP-binding protein homolog [Pyrococcus furiosus DSM 3638]AFN03702.1 ferric enterobactin transport ATP-binding protein [Pyrococcus furiosus COM1]QEK78578.1 ABC transporter ATP-binding protein [Pyrococcus furiosus DSM 3638]